MTVTIAFDLSRLYFTLKKTRLSLDYGRLVSLLKERSARREEVDAADLDFRVVGFTTFSEFNKNQRDFVALLTALGMDVRTYVPQHGADFTPEIIAYAFATDSSRLVMVTNAPNASDVSDILTAGGDAYCADVTIAYFGSDIPPHWTPLIVDGSVDFIDLCAPDVLPDIRRTLEFPATEVNT